MHETHQIRFASRMVIKSPAARLTFDNQHYLLPAGGAVAVKLQGSRITAGVAAVGQREQEASATPMANHAAAAEGTRFNSGCTKR